MSTIFEIPLPKNEDNFSLEVELSGLFFKLSFKWNTRGSFYSLELLNTNGDSLQTTSVISNANLFTRFENPLLPQGNLFFKDVTGKARDITRESLGNDFVLYYEDII